MDEYKESYLILWHSIDCAVEELMKQEYDKAINTLLTAQMEAEDAYINKSL